MVTRNSQTQEQAWQVPSVPAALGSWLAAAEGMAVEGTAAERTGSPLEAPWAVLLWLLHLLSGRLLQGLGPFAVSAWPGDSSYSRSRKQ